VKLPHLDRWNDQRRAAGAALCEALSETRVTVPAPVAADGDHVFHVFVVRTPDRDALREHLADRDVATAIHYPTPIHLQPAYAGLGQGPLPVSERLAKESCTLPIFPSISDEELGSIVEAVGEFRPRG
jgi:dTDP-4-amino-4,6-dideoxygalactose transaminase